jgi:CDP-diacylglycerol--glycerol-3-phosphate 3-phosphatidyltransferase
MAVISPSFRARVRSSIEQPVARFFGRLGFSPNGLTLIGFGIAVVAAYFAAVQSWLVAGVIVAFGAVFDLFDGALARATGKTSRFGAFLDSTLDRAGEAVVYIGIIAGCMGAGFVLGAFLAPLALATAFMVSYARAKAESLGFGTGSGLANVGLAPREVRIVILVVGLLTAGGSSLDGLAIALVLITVLATITTIQRILTVHAQAKEG